MSSENVTLKRLEEELQNAIAEENHDKAADIKVTLKNLERNNSSLEVFQADSEFYNCFKYGNFAAMQGIWSKAQEVCCVHPDGLKGISGYDKVIESWKSVWTNYNAPLEIRQENIRVYTRGDMGYVTCLEILKKYRGGAWKQEQNFVTKVFEKIDGEWFICIYHASRV